MELDQIRKEIDAIDDGLTELLGKRMDCSLRVAEIKGRAGLPVYHPQREQEIFDKVKAKSPEYGDYFVELYRLLMECSRALQNNALTTSNRLVELVKTAKSQLNVKGRVACYGQAGAFTCIALKQAFGEDNVIPHFCHTFDAVFNAVEQGEAEFGFLPVENSSAGSIDEVYDLLLERSLYISGAVIMPINHNLLGLDASSLEEIKTVYSHSQALSQCRDFLTGNGITPMAYANTAAAAKYVAEQNDPTIGAIGSLSCAEENGLKVLAQQIQSFKNNCTRFILITKQPIIPKNSNKISVVFSLAHTAGSLQRLLTRFSLYGLNLTKLESRPGRNGDFETQFYLDFLGSTQDEKTLSLMATLFTELNEFSFLGNYEEITL